MQLPDKAVSSREGFENVLEVIGVIRLWEVWDILYLTAFASSIKKGLISMFRF